MLNQLNAIPTIAVKDLQVAREFYEKKLGLTLIPGPMSEEVQHFKSGDAIIEVYHSEFAGTNKATAMTWQADNITEEVKNLKSKGVQFEHYDFPDLKMEGDVHVMGNVRAAWFKDPDGNILSLVNMQ